MRVRTLTVEERALVDRFAAGASVYAVAKSAWLTALRVERLIRLAMGVPMNGSRAKQEVGHG